MSALLVPANRPAASQWFGGSPAFASVPLALSGFNQLSISVWVWWNAFANDDHLAMEYSALLNSNPGSWYFDPDQSFSPGVGKLGIGLRPTGAAGASVMSFNRPSAKAWHHLLFVADLTQTAAAQYSAFYIDGALQTATGNNASAGTNPVGAFGNYTLYLMSRAGSSLFATGAMAQLALFAGTLLGADDAGALADGADPRGVNLGATHFWRMDRVGQEPNLGRFGVGGGTMTTSAKGMLALPAQLALPAGGPSQALSAGGGSIVAADCKVSAEWGSSARRAVVGGLEMSGQLAADATPPFEGTGSTQRGGGVGGELLAAVRHDRQTPIESGARLGFAASMPAEALCRALSAGGVPAEAAGSILALRDVALGGEFLGALRSAATAPGEAGSTMSSARGVAAEWVAQQVVRRGGPVEWSGAVLIAAEAFEEIEFSAGAGRDALASIGWLTSGANASSSDTGLRIEWQALAPTVVVSLNRLLKPPRRIRLIATPGRLRRLMRE